MDFHPFCFNRRFDDSRYGFRGERDQRGPRDREWGAPGRNDRLDRGGGRGGLNSRGGRRPRDNVPEWMDAPVNQDELMELRGFDDSPEKEAKPRVDHRDKIKMDKTKDEKKPKSNEFNIDDIIHMDVIPGNFSILIHFLGILIHFWDFDPFLWILIHFYGF